MRVSYKAAGRESNYSASEEEREILSPQPDWIILSLKPVAPMWSFIHMCPHPASHSSVHSYIWMMINNTGCGDSLPEFRLWFCHVPAVWVSLGK